MMLKVVNRKKEGHDAAQAQIDGFNRVVVVLKIAPDLECSDKVDHGRRERENLAVWGCVMSQGAHKSIHESTEEDPDNGKNDEEQAFAFRLKLSCERGFHDHPGMGKQSAGHDANQQHQGPVKVGRHWPSGNGRGSSSASIDNAGAAVSWGSAAIHSASTVGWICGRYGSGRNRHGYVADDLRDWHPVRHAFT